MVKTRRSNQYWRFTYLSLEAMKMENILKSDGEGSGEGGLHFNEQQVVDKGRGPH